MGILTTLLGFIKGVNLKTIKEFAIIGLLCVIVYMLFAKPKDTITNDALTKLNQVIKMIDESNTRWKESIEQQQSKIDDVKKLLEERGIGRDKKFNDLNDRYGTVNSVVWVCKDNSLGSELIYPCENNVSKTGALPVPIKDYGGPATTDADIKPGLRQVKF